MGLLALVVTGCSLPHLDPANTWKIYRNPRYGFEFPYPADWLPSRPPTNRDGQSFISPRNAQVEIVGWASQVLPGSATSRHIGTTNTPTGKQNFTTAQGLAGEVAVDVGPEISSLTLTLVQGQIVYNWQGRSPSAQFPDYYQFFSYVASQYQVLQETE